jgi:uncharacterized membrane protein HdeD (DUF308 family)
MDVMDSKGINQNLSDESHRWTWIFLTGVVYLLLGIISISVPTASTLGLTITLANLLIIGGLFYLVHSYKLRHADGNSIRFLRALVSIAAGGLMLAFLNVGMLGLTVILICYFFASAILQWKMFIGMQPRSAWLFASSAVSFLLGLFLVATLPYSALVMPGIMLGIDLIMAGSGLISFAFVTREPSLPSNRQMI